MKTSIHPFRFVIAFIIGFLLHTSICTYDLQAQNTGPNAPEAMSFEPVDATDMVNVLTGDFAYVLPLLEVPGPEGGYPIVLSYHGGIAMDQEASWVGLGWNINPGAITRNVSGVPDDWKEISIKTQLYDDGGSETYFSLGLGVSIEGLASFGVNFSWGSNRSLGFGLSAGIGIEGENSTFGIHGSVGTDGASVGVGCGFKDSGFGVSASIGVRNGKAFASAGVSGAMGMSSVGITLSQSGFSGGLSIAGNNVSLFDTGDQIRASDYTIHKSSCGFFVPFPILPGVMGYVSFGYTKISWWLNKSYYKMHSGVFYMENSRNDDGTYYGGLQNKDYVMDIYNIPIDAAHYKELKDFETKNCLSFPAYDNYQVNAQGVSGKMTPHLYENASIVGEGKVYEYLEDGESPKDEIYYFNDWYETDSHKNDYFNKQTDEIYFSFDFEHASYLKITNGDWIKHEETNLVYYTNTGGDTLTTNPDNFSNFNHNKLRTISGSYIDWISNEDIVNNTNLSTRNFYEYEDSLGETVDRSSMPQDGIGALNITTADGKTYHFSLPVYQHEEEFVDKWDNQNDYYKQTKTEPYASSWLLTALTGPDYVDNAPYGVIDNNDYGYWVKFNYGKWTEAFVWRFPYEGFKEYIDKDNETHYTYMKGRKEIYYLNWIKTKTHTAYFIKDKRDDGQGKLFQAYSSYSGPYFMDEEPFLSYYLLEEPLTEYIENSLRLNKIILTKNNSNIDNIDIDGESLYPSVVSDKLVGYSNEITDYIFTEDLLKPFYGNLDKNILDVNDVCISEIENNAIKTIKFKYEEENPLCYDTPNSSYIFPNGTGAKLTLGEVHFLGQNSSQVVPPYEFDYHRGLLNNYDKDSLDEWGYDKNDPSNWSLDKITTPNGAEIEIDYESDSYNKLGVEKFSSLLNVFNFNLVDENDSTLEETTGGINLLEYFPNAVGYPIEITSINEIVGFEFDPPNEPIEYKIDDETELTTHIVTNITSNTITFSPPLSSLIQYSYIDTDKYRGFLDVEKVGIENQYLERTKGGIRVSSISINDPIENKIYKTKYDYKNPNTGKTSGYTSYEPLPKAYEYDKYYIPYSIELPPPGVIYEYVSVYRDYIDDQNYSSKTSYKFDLPNTIENTESKDFKMDKFFNVSDTLFPDGDVWEQTGTGWTANHTFYGRNAVIEDNTSAIGRLLEEKTINSYGQTLSKKLYNYKEKEDISIGIRQETFKTKKRRFQYEGDGVTNNDILLTSSSRIKYPSVLDNIVRIQNGVKTVQRNVAFDFNSGKVLENVSELADGRKIKSKVIPAYEVYDGMGSKVVNPAYPNMLTQEAASYSYLLDASDNEIGVLGASVQTWNNDWYYRHYNGSVYFDEEVTDVWRKHKTYNWNGEIKPNGTYDQSFAEFDFSNSNPIDGNDWTKVNEITRYNHFSVPLESVDINGNYVATKMDVNNTKTMATVANANYRSFVHTSFEVEGSQIPLHNDYGGEVINTNSLSTLSHTGESSVLISAGVASGPMFIAKTEAGSSKSLLAGRTYRVSVWVHTSSSDDLFLAANLTGKINSTGAVISDLQKAYKSDASIVVGDWKLIELTIVVPEDYVSEGSGSFDDFRVYVSNAEGTVPAYVDDFRVCPINAAMSAYVYDPKTDLVTAILDNNNFATFYEYDDTGRLKKVLKETMDGVKLVSEHHYNFARFNNQFIEISEISQTPDPVTGNAMVTICYYTYADLGTVRLFDNDILISSEELIGNVSDCIDVLNVPAGQHTYRLEFIHPEYSATSMDSETIDVIGTITPILTISPTSKTVVAAGETFNVTVTNNLNDVYTVTENASWLSYTKSGSIVTITCNSNLLASSRSHTVSITGGGITKTVAVTQSAAAPSITVSPTSKTVVAAGETFNVTVTNNLDNVYTITETCDWISTSKSGSTVTITCTPNTTFSSRVYTVYFIGGGITKYITITQNGILPLIKISPTSKTAASGGESFDVTVTNNLNDVYTVTESASWLSYTRSGNTVSITCTSNNTGSTRNANVTFSGEGVSQVLTITQESNPLYLNVSTTTSNISGDSQDVNISVYSNVSWSVSDNSDWISILPSYGSNNGVITISCTYNLKFARSGIVTITGGGITKTININQDAIGFL